MLRGIDVYKSNGKIDWNRVKRAGIDFAMIKATQGRGETELTKNVYLFADPNFRDNILGAAAAGIPTGAWHWLTAKTVHEAKIEADFFLQTIRPYKSNIKLWAAADVESDKHLPTAKSVLTPIVRAFLERVADAGYKPMLYTNPNYLTYRYTPGAFDDTDIWLAHYNAHKPMDVPNLRIWQYDSVGTEYDVAMGWARTASGRIPGINAACDLDVGYFELADILGEREPQKPTYKAGGKYTIKAGDVYIYSNGREQPVPDTLVGKEYTISQVKEGKILLREIVSWVKG